MDMPNARSSHQNPTPRGGGLAMVVAFLIGIILIHLIGDKSPIYSLYFVGFLAAAFMIATISFYDDVKHCAFEIKLAGQLLAVIVAMSSGIVIDVMHLPLLGEVGLGWWAYPITLLWVFGLTNAYNFIDGLDGLAASTAVIAAIFLSYISFQQGSHFIYLASMTLAAAALGFLIFNLPTAKIFMGDVGSTFLGLVFAVMAVIAARYDHSHTSLFVVPLLLFHFIFDTTYTFARRLIAGEHVFTAHRTHLYQLLNRMGLSHGKVTAIYSLLAIVQGWGAILMMDAQGSLRVLIFVPFGLLYMLLALFIMRKAKLYGII
ncbi:MAG: undecaprenyl/decaprenyl-phosphate alpha-N-acetylglucosaminyl 1-phosphate transferase [Gammaproteobacteria bacterium]|nr:undecaprenyl/decaprenyl-phosphate alpha-N-acetylglucosaminyl 1-phosphate transferase [Gammaproteobacteria bacterium]MBU1446755.1 undecaprenyl/decaprenyl-phosphate alpha-N-acetylglucosaminyl 1-phosphate transferase [Gammaproteobacteria bacterium]